jgi:HEAT repeat protein
MNVDLTNLKMTDEEERLFDWCHANLEEEQLAEVEGEALEFAMKEINAPEAAEKLLELLVTVMIRNAEERTYSSKGARRTTKNETNKKERTSGF